MVLEPRTSVCLYETFIYLFIYFEMITIKSSQAIGEFLGFS